MLLQEECIVHESPNIIKCASESFEARLLSELENAYDNVRSYMVELGQVLDQSRPDRARLTTVRLKLAQLRLVQAAAVGRACKHLMADSDAVEQSELEEVQLKHEHLLKQAAAHTATWTLDIVDANWAQFQQATRSIVGRWREKTNVERNILYPLLKKRLNSAS